MRDCQNAVSEIVGHRIKEPAVAAIYALAMALDKRLDRIQANVPLPQTPDLMEPVGPASVNDETMWRQFDEQKKSKDRIAALVLALRAYYEQDHVENHTGTFGTCSIPRCINARALLGDD